MMLSNNYVFCISPFDQHGSFIHIARDFSRPRGTYGVPLGKLVKVNASLAWGISVGV